MGKWKQKETTWKYIFLLKVILRQDGIESIFPFPSLQKNKKLSREWHNKQSQKRLKGRGKKADWLGTTGLEEQHCSGFQGCPLSPVFHRLCQEIPGPEQTPSTYKEASKQMANAYFFWRGVHKMRPVSRDPGEPLPLPITSGSGESILLAGLVLVGSRMANLPPQTEIF